MVRIHIADDHPLIREGIKKILQEESDMIVVGETSSGLEVFNSIKGQEIDIVLLDISMPGKNGLDILKDLRYNFPKLPVLILSMHSEERFAVRALKAGAAGYVTKEAAPEELVKAIVKIMTGGKYISERLAEKLADELDDTSEKPLHETLSDREYQVMRLIAFGKNVNEIAGYLSLSPRTIYTYRLRIFKKMKMNKESDIIHYAIQNKLVD